MKVVENKLPKDIDLVELTIHLRNADTVGELLSTYHPESEPETSFGYIYSNVGWLIMEEMSAAQRAIGEGPDA